MICFPEYFNNLPTRECCFPVPRSYRVAPGAHSSLVPACRIVGSEPVPSWCYDCIYKSIRLKIYLLDLSILLPGWGLSESWMQEPTGNETDRGTSGGRSPARLCTVRVYVSAVIHAAFLLRFQRGQHSQLCICCLLYWPFRNGCHCKKRFVFFFLWNLIPWPGTNIWHAWLCATAQIFLVGDGKGFSDSKLKCPLWTIKCMSLFSIRTCMLCYQYNQFV